MSRRHCYMGRVLWRLRVFFQPLFDLGYQALQALRGGLVLEMFSPELDPKGMFKPRWRVRLRANVGQEVTDQILESKN